MKVHAHSCVGWIRGEGGSSPTLLFLLSLGKAGCPRLLKVTSALHFRWQKEGPLRPRVAAEKGCAETDWGRGGEARGRLGHEDLGMLSFLKSVCALRTQIATILCLAETFLLVTGHLGNVTTP